jgi:hypothetical protein
VLRKKAGEQFYNTSPLGMVRLLDDAPNLVDNLGRLDEVIHHPVRCATSPAAEPPAMSDLERDGCNGGPY